MSGWPVRSSFNTIRTGEIAYGMVTTVAVAAMVCFLYFDRLSRTVSDLEELVGGRLSAWNEIINYCDYLNGLNYAEAPNSLITNVQTLIGQRLETDADLGQQLTTLVGHADAGALGYYFPGEVTSLVGYAIQPSVRRIVSELQKTAPSLLEARLSEISPSDAILIFSRKALIPLQNRLDVLRLVRSHLAALRTSAEWIFAIVLPMAIWTIWFMVLRPRLVRSLELQSKIEASERRAHITLSSIGDAVVVAGADGTVASLNPAAERLLGGSQQALVGRDISSFIELRKPAPSREVQLGVKELWTLNETVSHRVELVRLRVTDEDRTRSINLTASPIAYPGEAEQGVVLVLRDITDELKMREELHTTEKARAVVGLAAGLAHEFNNALAIISGARELTALKLQTNEGCANHVGRHLKAIEGAVLQSKGLTAQLLAIGSQAKLKLTTIDVMEPLSAVVAQLGHASRNSVRIVLNSELKDTVGLIEGNAAALQRVFVNLGLNSIHAMGGAGEIVITVKSPLAGDAEGAPKSAERPEAPSFIVVEWRDNGHGIAERDLKRVFDPFFTTGAEEGSAGLGLSIVRGIIVEHRGSIVADSKAGEGAVFTIHLPARGERDVEHEPEIHLPAREGPSIRALVVEDRADFAEALREYLAINSIWAEVAMNGVEAVEKFERGRDAFDIVVLDMNLPGKSGVEVEAEIRALKPLCKIIASTGNLAYGDGQSAGTHGLTVVMKKPYELNELVATIRKMCAGQPVE